MLLLFFTFGCLSFPLSTVLLESLTAAQLLYYNPSPRLLWSVKRYCPIQKNPRLEPVLSQFTVNIIKAVPLYAMKKLRKRGDVASTHC
jgi:hypothetical protein